MADKFDYIDTKELADELLDEFGLYGTAVTMGDPVLNEETGIVEAVKTESDGFTVLSQLNAKYREANASLVQEGDVMLLCTASFNLEPGTMVKHDGQQWQVIKANPVKPADVVCMYKAHARLRGVADG